MDASPPEQSSWLIQFIVVVCGAVGVTLASFFKGLKSNEKPGRSVIEAAEITDTKALSEKIIADLTPKLEYLIRGAADRDRKIDEALEKLERLERKEEMAREAREEVARQLEMRERRHPAE